MLFKTRTRAIESGKSELINRDAMNTFPSGLGRSSKEFL